MGIEISELVDQAAVAQAQHERRNLWAECDRAKFLAALWSRLDEEDRKLLKANARFFAQPLPVVLHILVVIPYSIVGAFQFSPGLRRRRRNWHRAAGRILAVFGLVAALTGLWMAHFYPWPEGDGEVVYLERLVFGSAMAASIVLAIAAIRRRDFASHGAWMTRANAIALGAGTQVLTHLPWFILVGKAGESSRAVLRGAGWVINVIVAEWIIRKRTTRRSTVPAYAAG